MTNPLRSAVVISSALTLFIACDSGPSTPNRQAAGAGQPQAQTCGNGTREGTEQCDLGQAQNGQPGSTCSQTCTNIGAGAGVGQCGDGRQDANEQCDLGQQNGQPGSTCSQNCTLISGGPGGIPGQGGIPGPGPAAPGCGNGLVEFGEQCDFGPQNGSPGSPCSAFCTLQGVGGPGGGGAFCGNGVLEPGEFCDFGPQNGFPGVPCSSFCTPQ